MKQKSFDIINGKANDDGYRGIHLYYQKTNEHYPIEIQINTKYDRIMNDWLHIYVYKYEKNNVIGELLRKRYDSGEIQNESDFKEILKDVLLHTPLRQLLVGKTNKLISWNLE